MEISNTHAPLWIMAESGSSSQIKALHTSSDGYLITGGIFNEEIILGDITLNQGLVYSNYVGVITYDVYVGLEEREEGISPFIYANGTVYCKEFTSNSRLKVLDVEGKELLNVDVKSFDTVRLNGLSSGVYLVQLYLDNQLFSKKIIIQ
jgi:hypothetical protein